VQKRPHMIVYMPFSNSQVPFSPLSGSQPEGYILSAVVRLGLKSVLSSGTCLFLGLRSITFLRHPCASGMSTVGLPTILRSVHIGLPSTSPIFSNYASQPPHGRRVKVPPC
jgi:hypothetical protein